MILSASAGALFVVVAIDFLADVGFREVGGLLLVKRLDGAGNGARGGMGAREKGLLVGWWAFLLAGIAAQIYIGPNDVESVRPSSLWPSKKLTRQSGEKRNGTPTSVRS